MSLLGIDVGTTGCKAAVFSVDGRLIASAYREYDVQRPQPGRAELDAAQVWAQIEETIGEAASRSAADPITALSVSSLGEAMVPVSADRRILGPSLLNFDARGAEHLAGLRRLLPDERLYRINGNTLGNQYSLPKLRWVQEYQPGLYEQTYKFLLWGSFVSFMLGGEPVADYSLANRTLLFDLDRADWSEDLLALAGIDRAKLPGTAPSATVIGHVSGSVAARLGLPHGVAIVSGAHDQCANAVGCGVIQEGRAVYGMGTYICITPTYARRRGPSLMIKRGLNTEHHAAPGLYVSFIYNQGGALLKWFRDTFAALEHRQGSGSGRDIYAALLAEMPDAPSSVVALPHWAQIGPPDFVSDSSGVLVGLRLETTRGDILKGMLEGATFYLKECIESLAVTESLPSTGIEIADFCAAGGGSKSDAWIQLSADIMGRPFVRPAITEAGALGAAIIAGVGSGAFSSFAQGVEAMVRLDRTFEPERGSQQAYESRFARYKPLWPLLREYLRELHRQF
jgi:xylulokinase